MRSGMSQPSPNPDPEGQLAALLGRMAQEDEAALETFYDLLSPRVFGLARQICRSPEVAEELTVDIFHEAWRRAPQFDASRGSAITWLLTLTRSRSIDRLRSMLRKRLPEDSLPLELVDLPDPAPDPELALGIRERTEVIRMALSQLAPEQARVVGLSFYGGLSHGEIAERLALPLGTVKGRIRLGLQHLSRIIPVMEDLS